MAKKPVSIGALIKALKDEEHSTRLSAARELAERGNPQGLEALFRAQTTLGPPGERALERLVEVAGADALGPLLVASNSKLPERAALAGKLKAGVLAGLSVEERAGALLACMDIKSQAGLDELYERAAALPLEHRLRVWVRGMDRRKTRHRSRRRIQRADEAELEGLLVHAEVGPPPPFGFRRDKAFSRRLHNYSRSYEAWTALLEAMEKPLLDAQLPTAALVALLKREVLRRSQYEGEWFAKQLDRRGERAWLVEQLGHESSEVKCAVLKALWTVRDPALAPALGALQADPDSLVRQTAMYALRWSFAPSQTAVAVAGLSDASASVRRNAADLLVYNAVDGALEALEARLAVEEDPDVLRPLQRHIDRLRSRSPAR